MNRYILLQVLFQHPLGCIMIFNGVVPEKYLPKLSETYYHSLPVPWQQLLTAVLADHQPSFQTFRFLTQIFKDFASWQVFTPKQLRQEWGVGIAPWAQWIKPLEQRYQQLLLDPEKNYQRPPSHVAVGPAAQANWQPLAVNEKIIGRCPVASEKTRCCNLLTLDAFRSCGFNCSYCSIQSFFQQKYFYDPHLPAKLAQLTAEFSDHPDKLYHLGTGQSSDSLLWGNREGALGHLLEFAKSNPNVILEFKTKSDNINYLLSHPVPANVICTWSLNPQEVINWEEVGTASLERRLAAASAIAQQGNLVGFHFHPMVYYRDFVAHYREIAHTLLARFAPSQVAMVSLGTLTYTKKVMREIRKKPAPSKILQMPLAEIAGKYSYPPGVKVELFQTLYQSLAPWHSSVFFYLCMEDLAIWDLALGHSYASNQGLEQAMLASYAGKISALLP